MWILYHNIEISYRIINENIIPKIIISYHWWYFVGQNYHIITPMIFLAHILSNCIVCWNLLSAYTASKQPLPNVFILLFNNHVKKLGYLQGVNLPFLRFFEKSIFYTKSIVNNNNDNIKEKRRLWLTESIIDYVFVSSIYIWKP